MRKRVKVLNLLTANERAKAKELGVKDVYLDECMIPDLNYLGRALEGIQIDIFDREFTIAAKAYEVLYHRAAQKYDDFLLPTF